MDRVRGKFMPEDAQVKDTWEPAEKGAKACAIDSEMEPTKIVVGLPQFPFASPGHKS